MLSFFNLYHSKIKSSWGLHITSRHLRAIKVAQKGKSWRIETVSKLDLPKGVVDMGVILDNVNFIKFLEELKHKVLPESLKSPYITTNLSEVHAFFRTINMPELSPEEMEEAVYWEAESNIPLPVEKVYLAWDKLPEKENNKLTVLISATPKSVIDQLIGSLKRAKLIPLIIEPESAALLRGLTLTNSLPILDAPILILDLKEHYTHIIAFDAKVVRLSTTSEHCSVNFDLALAEAFKIKEEEAEKYRQRIGWNEQEELGRKLIEATSNAFQNLKKDILSAVSFYGNKSNRDIKQIVLTGEKKSKWLGFDRFLEKEIGLPVDWQKVWNPEIWPSKSPYLDEENEEYNIAIGLALRKLEEE